MEIENVKERLLKGSDSSENLENKYTAGADKIEDSIKHLEQLKESFYAQIYQDNEEIIDFGEVVSGGGGGGTFVTFYSCQE